MKRLVCWLRGHTRYPGAAWYWHSHERCARCDRLVEWGASDADAKPKGWA